ncbi:YHS domain-containing (seleno)protein [Flavitalea flava]
MKLFAFSLLLLAFTQVNAQKSEVFVSSGAAIKGYDAVAYFTEGKPVKGDKKFSYNWKGADWYFSNQQNLTSFKADPVKYAPQYGGYCAYGTSEGHKAPIDPQAWTIVGNKLYLNYDKDIKVKWSKDQQTRIKQADMNWPKIRDKE